MIRICPACMRDWSLIGTARKLLCIFAFALVIGSMFPISITGQSGNVTPYLSTETADQVRLRELERRADRSDRTPDKIATMSDRITSLETTVKALDSHVDTIDTRAWLILVAALAALFDRLLGAFGIKIRDRGPE